MIDITLALTGILILFALFVALRSLFSLQICALCGAVFLTWLVLLILFYLHYAIHPTLIALLMGGSIVGSMYLLEHKLRKQYRLFKVPYFLTLISVAYFLLVKNVTLAVVLILASVWIGALLIHTGTRVEGLKTLGRKIIDCCKHW